MNISKELLSAVLGRSELWYKNIAINGTDVMWISPETVTGINIYELAHQCKEWALNNGYELVINSTDIRIEFIKNKLECAYTIDELLGKNYDPNRIFKACEWILKERMKDNEI